MALKRIGSKCFLIFGLSLILSMFTSAFSGTNKVDAQSLKVSSSFNEFFDLKETFELSQEKVLIGSVRVLKIDDEGNIWILDSRKIEIKKYSKSGHFLAAMGEKSPGPGGFERPWDFFIFKDKIYVTDPISRRIHVFDRQNRKFKYFIKVRDGRMIHVRNEDNIILSGQLLSLYGKEPVRKEEWLCLHISNRKGKSTKSFFPLNEFAKRNLVCDSIFFCVDEEDNIFGVQETEYKIHKFTSDGQLARVFPIQNHAHYTPPPKEPFNRKFLRSQAEAWMNSWSHIIGIAVYKDYLFVTLSNPSDKPYEFYYDAYTRNGKFVKGGLGADYRLLYIDKEGMFYFLKETETNDGEITFSILKYALSWKQKRQ
ncbi:MAG: 6-bladed beta-propeller [Candidatus Aminicenantes bacterium]|nr:MAG: 6-bladed beta-propeller [Candidatus Aminicenantes bacterium]